MNKIYITIIILLFPFFIEAQIPPIEWAKSVGGVSFDTPSSIIADGAGNVITVGNFKTTSDFDPGIGVANLTSAGSFDPFIVKLNSSGDFVWARSVGGTMLDQIYSVTVDDSENIYLTGNFQGTADFDPGSGTFNLSSSGGTDVYVLKLNSSGDFVWVKKIGGTLNESGSSIIVDPTGNVYVTGSFMGNCDFDPGANTFNLGSSGSTDVFITKLNSSGNLTWVKKMGGWGSDNPASIKIGNDGSVYTAGYFSDTADFDPGAGIFNLNSKGDSDIFISKLDDSGNFIWAKEMGGTGLDKALSMTLDPLGNVYTTGLFEDSVDFDPGSAVANFTCNEYEDVFISKLDSSGNYLWTKTIGGASEQGKSIALDLMNNAFILGNFTTVTDMDPGPDTFNLTPIGFTGMFILKLDSLGNFSGAKGIGVTEFETVQSICVDEANAIYSTGILKSSGDIDPDSAVFNLTYAGANDAFIIKMGGTIIGITVNNVTKEILIYPNPTNGSFNISINTKNSIIEVYNSIGTLIQKQTSTSEQSTIDISNEAKGLYLIKVISKGNISTSKIIKQ
jgi:hypothetical protein